MKKFTDSNKKNLTRRYLIWCYKTTKEELDKIDRYYTQIEADHYILKRLVSSKSCSNREFKKLVTEYENYIHVKKKNVDAKKYSDSKARKVQTNYQYLKERFLAIERAIVYFLGKKELARITELYENEMTERILAAREHK